MRNPSATRGYMLGSMAGDTIGLPYERLSRGRVHAIVANKPLRQRLVFGHGMVSDDTEHAAMTLLAWRKSEGDLHAFSKHLAKYLQRWFLCLPPGCGMATAKSCVRLLLRVPPDRSGVHSAGNGPAMRTGVLGTLCESEEELKACVRMASRITHTDPRAEDGALAVAFAARVASESYNSTTRLDAFRNTIAKHLPDGDMKAALELAITSVEAEESTEVYATRICGRAGVSGFIMHTVPVAIHIWLCEQGQVQDGIQRAILLGGDTDTLAAIVGGVLGAQFPDDLPTEWLGRVKDYPLSRSYIEALCRPGESSNTPRAWRCVCQPIRNAVFFAVVLTHVIRRAFPPYARSKSPDEAPCSPTSR